MLQNYLHRMSKVDRRNKEEPSVWHLVAVDKKRG